MRGGRKNVSKILRNSVLDLAVSIFCPIFVVQNERETPQSFCNGNERKKSPALVSQRTTGLPFLKYQYKGMETIQTYQTTYAVATSFIPELIQVKNVAGIQCLLSDEAIGYNIDEETGEYPDIMEYYLTQLNESTCKQLNDHFGLIFARCTALDLWVLLVPHCGTGWDYVRVTTDLEQYAAPLGTSKLN